MPECLVCHGDGELDFRDIDAHLEEHLTDAQLALAREGTGVPWMAIVECEECEGTGVISEDRYRDMMAAATAYVDQAMAKVDAEGE